MIAFVRPFLRVEDKVERIVILHLDVQRHRGLSGRQHLVHERSQFHGVEHVRVRGADAHGIRRGFRRPIGLGSHAGFGRGIVPRHLGLAPVRVFHQLELYRITRQMVGLRLVHADEQHRRIDAIGADARQVELHEALAAFALNKHGHVPLSAVPRVAHAVVDVRMPLLNEHVVRREKRERRRGCVNRALELKKRMRRHDISVGGGETERRPVAAITVPICVNVQRQASTRRGRLDSLRHIDRLPCVQRSSRDLNVTGHCGVVGCENRRRDAELVGQHVPCER